MIQCDICEKKFNSRKSMTNHRRWHDLPEYKDYQRKFKKSRQLAMKGANNPNWTGDDVSYKGVHIWINRYKPKPEFCEECGKLPPKDCHNISGEYKRDINDYIWLCRKCHMESDGRMNNRDKGGKFDIL